MGSEIVRDVVIGMSDGLTIPKEMMQMADKTSKKKTKRLSKGQRKHVRRLKQDARKTGPIPK